jgi:hypothetical protein
MLKVACPLTLSFPSYSQPYSCHLRINLHKKKYILEWENGDLLPSIVSICKLPEQKYSNGLWQWVIHYTNIMLDTVH